MIGTAITTMIMESTLCRIVIVIIEVRNGAGKYLKKFTVFAVLKFPYFDIIVVDNN
jgi:hypothetical protein